MISPELDRHFREVGALFGRRRRPRREKILDTVRSVMYTAIAIGRVVLPLGGWVLACTLALRVALRLAGAEDPPDSAHVGIACGVFAWAFNCLLADVED